MPVKRKHSGDDARTPCIVDVILFDFGGVLADEGFKNGLVAIASQHGMEPGPFLKTGFDLVHKTGYVMGKADEKAYWQALREATGIQENDELLRKEILERFSLRTWMMDLVKELRKSGVVTGILSDQTNWLDELNERYDLFKWFDFIFNSYRLGKSKSDETLFDDVLTEMKVKAERVLFIDDHPGNIERARKRGLQTLWYQDCKSFVEKFRNFCPLSLFTECAAGEARGG